MAGCDAMNEQQAREILGDSIRKDGGLFNLSHLLWWETTWPKAILNDELTANELEAIAFWMRREQK